MLTRWCHLSPQEVDGLSVRDFRLLQAGIDEERAMIERQNKEAASGGS